MSFVSLVIHGISSYTVHLETVVIRLLVLFSLFILLSIFGIIAIILLQIFSDLFIAEWVIYTLVGLIIIIFQAFFSILNLAVNTLYYRIQKLFIPAIDYKDYIDNIKKTILNVQMVTE